MLIGGTTFFGGRKSSNRSAKGMRKGLDVADNPQLNLISNNNKAKS
jgi:hypothetical protein